ncbi:hypothetical protein [Pseudooceanicola sp.]|uniref:hypothetical protein n=1 Tax=Pseudooceanicola sp. TaxID=1914328 RepID=UPI0035C6939B
MERPDKFDEDDILAFSRGEAPADVAARIEAAAATDETLRAELALMGGLRGALAAATDGPDTREFGWRRLQAEIAKSEDHAPEPRARPHVWRIAAMFLGALVIGQGAYIAVAPGTNNAPAFRPVSDEVAGFTLAIAFTAEAAMADIEALLRDTGGRIVDGPSAIGLYRISFESEDALAAARDRLSASPLVDLLAEE